MKPMKPRLSIRFEGLVVRTYVLDKECVTVGRRSESDIQLDDSAASGAHARLVLEDSPYFEGYATVHLEDAGSTNGTFVNGERVKERHLLKNGDMIRIGRHELAYEEATGAMDTTVFLLADQPS